MSKTKAPTIPERLSALCESRGWSVYRLAQESGVSRDYLGQVLRGEKSPTLGVLERIAAALGVRVELVE